MMESLAGRPVRGLVAAAAVPPVALVADRWLGEPPILHPVVGMGCLLDVAASRRSRATTPASATVAGGAGLAAALVVVVVGARRVERAVRGLPVPLAVALEGLALAMLLSDALLRDEGRRVDWALAEDLAAGRRAVSALVSRDTATLDTAEVRAGAIESMAENTGDSVVGPLLAWALAGLPGAAGYRLVNTADAMWGYRGEPWEWWGKAAARLDDLLNLVPARVAARLLAPRVSWRRIRHEAARTPSPNAGWPMAAVACRFGLRLAKPGVYALNDEGRAPGPGDIDAVAAIVGRTATAATALAVGVAIVGALLRGRSS